MPDTGIDTPSKPGAHAPGVLSPGASNAIAQDSYLPDFCSGKTALAIVLIAELVAITLALAGTASAENFWTDLARLSMLLLWVGLANAAVLCVARRFLVGASVTKVTAVSMTLILLVCAIISELTFQLGQFAFPDPSTQSLFPRERGPFIARTLGISFITGALMLRYFYVTQQWRKNVQLEARSRVRALQARIRPHFLFNSMNTIAELTRSDPLMAEQAVEDLADLFRATLADSMQKVRIKDELEMARMYQRIEQLRLGDRLTVEWAVETLPMRALIPGISIQPLLENAIYHGIEPMAQGGTILVEGETKGDFVTIMISNPVAPDNRGGRKGGNHIALDNIRQRFDLAYDGQANVKTSLIDDRFSVYLRFPLREHE
ncbi:MAG: histidine kinase [Pseudomonadota bacterium]